MLRQSAVKCFVFNVQNQLFAAGALAGSSHGLFLVMLDLLDPTTASRHFSFDLTVFLV